MGNPEDSSDDNMTLVAGQRVPPGVFFTYTIYIAVSMDVYFLPCNRIVIPCYFLMVII